MCLTFVIGALKCLKADCMAGITGVTIAQTKTFLSSDVDRYTDYLLEHAVGELSVKFNILHTLSFSRPCGPMT